MDDTTKTMMLTLATGIIKKGLITLGATAATHGIISANQTETFVAAGMFLVGAGWSFWNDYGRAIVLSQIEVLKAKSLAQAAKMKDAGVPPVTVNQVAAQSPTLTPAAVTKTIATLPTEVQQNVAKVLALLAIGSLLAFASAGAAHAQGKLKLPIDPLGLNNRSAVTSSSSGDPIDRLLDALDAKLLPDLKYALALANASGSKVTAPCYTAWIAIIETRQSAAKNADGSPMGEPDPDIVTKFEKMVELRNALQPESDFMIHCSPVASMVKKDIAGFIGVVLSGGAGLATLVPGL